MSWLKELMKIMMKILDTEFQLQHVNGELITSILKKKKTKNKQEKAGKRENQTVFEPIRGQMLPL